MERDLAQLIVNCAMRSITELANIVPTVNAHTSTKEAKEIRRKIAGIIADINIELLNSIYDQFPEIEIKSQTMMEKYGRIF